MITFDVVGANKITYFKLAQIPDHPYKVPITNGSGSGKANTLLNLINHQPDIDKIDLYVKDLFGSKY